MALISEVGFSFKYTKKIFKGSFFGGSLIFVLIYFEYWESRLVVRLGMH